MGWGIDWIDQTESGQVEGCCECDNEPSDFLNYVKFLYQLRTC
jgi:hypothetical protein